MKLLENLGSISPIGLGCSRLGSVLGADESQSIQLIKTALDHGVNVFDTSDIYGQGDSERILGQVLRRRSDVAICTKVGKTISPTRRMLLPFKRIIRQVAGSSSSARQGVSKARSKPMPTNWSPGYLSSAIERSLSRLKRDHIDIILLHGVDIATIQNGAALDTLDRARAHGKVGQVGISVDDPATAIAALMDDRVSVLQVPIHPGSEAYASVLEQARKRNVQVIAREIFGGARSERPPTPSERAQILASLVENDDIALSLIGTTKPQHLLEAINSLPHRLRPAC